MKKAILIMAALAITATTFAQSKTDTVKTVKVAAVAKKPEYVKNPKMMVHIDLQVDEVESILTVAPAGLFPFLKTTQVPMNQFDSIEDNFKNILVKLRKQKDDQVEADRLTFLKTDSLKAITAHKK